MYLSTTYDSPVGTITLASSDEGLVGLWNQNQKHFGSGFTDELTPGSNAILKQAHAWLKAYFKGDKPAIDELPLAPQGSEFRQAVWRILQTIPYGELTTYGEIAKELARAQGKEKISSQAVGGAVGHNPISIIIPCHRVVSSNGSLTGYAGGIKTKIALLELEEADLSKTFIPKKGTAL